MFSGDAGAESDSDDEIDEAEETALESYETPLDKEDCGVDEYQIFKQLLEGNYTFFRGSSPRFVLLEIKLSEALQDF